MDADDPVIASICKRLRCSVVTSNAERLLEARDKLTKLQHLKIFEHLFGNTDAYFDEPEPEEIVNNAVKGLSLIQNDIHYQLEENDFEEDEEEEERTEQSVKEEELELHNLEAGGEEDYVCGIDIQTDIYEPIIDDEWKGYFRGYEILAENVEIPISETRKCIELTKQTCNEDLDAYLRAGVRCFIVDIFSGNERDNQSLIVRLRENEIKVATDFGFPVASTIVAKLTPRLQYIGLLDPPNASIELIKDNNITLTVDRDYSTVGSEHIVYVNARFLIADIKPCDFLLIGQDIQLQVLRKKGDRLYCKIVVGGKLKSRMPVLFPGKCNKFRLSMEELQDLTFAKEVGINVIISYIIGTKEYFDNIREALALLHCDRMRLCARVVLNEIVGCENDLKWAAECYDGFLIELNRQDEQAESEVLHLCPAAQEFIKYAYELQKPIILDPGDIATKRLLLRPEQYLPLLYYPDRYLFKCDQSAMSFYFYNLQEAIFEEVSKAVHSTLPYCDYSQTGMDSMARACVAASLEMHASLIIHCGSTGRTAIKISHFRPKAPILLVATMKSAADFISMYNNIILLQFIALPGDDHLLTIYKQALFGLLYALTRKMVTNGDNVIIVYSKDAFDKYSDRYLVYKVNSNHFLTQLKSMLYRQ